MKVEDKFTTTVNEVEHQISATFDMDSDAVDYYILSGIKVPTQSAIRRRCAKMTVQQAKEYCGGLSSVVVRGKQITLFNAADAAREQEEAAARAIVEKHKLTAIELAQLVEGKTMKDILAARQEARKVESAKM